MASDRLNITDALILTERLYNNKKYKQAAYVRANLYFGFRVGDFIKNVTWGKLLDQNQITITPEKTERFNKICRRQIPYELKEFIERCWNAAGKPDKGETLWTVLYKGRRKPASKIAINKMFKRWVDYYDLRDTAGDTIINFSTHSIRKTAAWDLYESQGKDIVAVKDWLLHESVETTRAYLGIKEDELRKIEEDRNIQMLERINRLKIHA